MGELRVTIEVSASGPLADGTAHQAVREWLDASKRDVADFAVQQLRDVKMDKTGRGTGHYQSQLQTVVIGSNDILIKDPVIYGPWLEGTSQRNRSTRFKGYHLWRKARLAAQRQAPDIAQKRWPDYADRIGATL